MMIDLSTTTPLLATWLQTAWARLPWILLGSGVAVLWLSLLVLMLSRWGQARPLSKCAALSVLVHVLLLGYAYMTNLLQPPMLGPGRSTVSVQLLTDPAVEAIPEPLPSWQPSSRPPEELAETALPAPELWQQPASIDRAEALTDAPSELSELLRDLPASVAAVPLPAEDLDTTATMDSVPATQISLAPPRRRPRAEQPIATAPPSPPRSAPTPPQLAPPRPAEFSAPEPPEDRQSLALLPNHEELADWIAAARDHDADTVTGHQDGDAASTFETAEGRVPSRTVSMATPTAAGNRGGSPLVPRSAGSAAKTTGRRTGRFSGDRSRRRSGPRLVGPDAGSARRTLGHAGMGRWK